MTVEQIARDCHEANKGYCESIGDDSQVGWDRTSPDIRQSTVAGMMFALDNPGATPEAQHLAWTASKLRDGWVCGPAKDAVAKTHPCLVPYQELPVEQRLKDSLFLAVVRALTGPS